ncbi:MAG: APC family permease, partial [bacterium]|nr:APC family permease [Candidatus Kapabacteria bacterium]
FGQSAAFGLVIPITLGIAVLLVIVATSYRQTIHAYPSGGGAYIVAKENLGTTPGLVAGAALLVDYVLTVSVSIAAGVAAITSAVNGTSFDWIGEHKVLLCIVFIAFIALANLRGVRESGALFSIPTYAFLTAFLFMIGYGVYTYFTAGPPPQPTNEQLKIAEGYAMQPLTMFLILGAFSNGCAALTGIEAISNGVPAFKKPEAKNASTTLVIMAILLTTMFIGTSVMAYLYGVHPHPDETVISQFARIMFTDTFSWFYFVVQASTAMILILAANTAFADFPRLASLLARDRFLPRQFANRGDRLVFSNGVILLAIFAALLVWMFGGDTSRLIPLYAVGVFLSFTLSQSGMVRHWMRLRRQRGASMIGGNAIDGSQPQKARNGNGRAAARSAADPQVALSHDRPSEFVEDSVTSAKNWKWLIAVNGVGAVATFVVLCVFITTKFLHGAWIVVVIIPTLVLLFRGVYRHYARVAKQLAIEKLEPLRPIKHTVIVPISGLHRGVVHALEYARSLAPAELCAVYVDIDEAATQRLKKAWDDWGVDVPLVILDSPYRSLARPLMQYIREIDMKWDDDVLTIVVPEFVPARWWQHLMHNQSSLLLKGTLLFKRGIIVTSIPYHLDG